MAIYRGSGGSVEGITESDTVTIAISQGGTGAKTAADARTNLGLGTAATTAASDYATAAQGTLADSAVQPGDIGTAAAQNVGYFATAAQGALADSAIQAGDLATVATTGSYDDLTDKPTLTTSLEELTDVTITSVATNDVLQYNGTAWVNAVISGGGGDGSVTSVAMTVPTGLSVSGSPITSAGTLAVTYASGYSIPTTTNQTNWSTAYGWGNHASAGYATALDGLSDVVVTTPSSGQVLKYNGTSWINDTDATGGGGGATYLPILNHSGTTIEISIAAGYITVTNHSGSTVSVPVY